MFAKFETIEEYNTINKAIAAFKDIETNGEYSRTQTEFEYNPEPESNWDDMYYMPAESKFINAGLFNGIELVSVIPIETIENNDITE